MRYLRQSTEADVELGPGWNANVEPVSDLDIDSPGIVCRASKNGTEVDITLSDTEGPGHFRPGASEGQYLLTLPAAVTDTIGRLRVSLGADGLYINPEDFTVQSAGVYDVLHGVASPAVRGDVPTTADVKAQVEGALDDYGAAKSDEIPDDYAKPGDEMGLKTATVSAIRDGLSVLTAGDIPSASDAAEAVWAADERTVTGVEIDVETLAAAVAEALIGADICDESEVATAVVALLRSLKVQVVGPVMTTGDIELHRGDDYKMFDGRALGFEVPNPGHGYGLDQPQAAVYLKATEATWTAVQVTATDEGWWAVFELTAADTARLVGKVQAYEIELLTAAGHVITLGDSPGNLILIDDIPAKP